MILHIPHASANIPDHEGFLDDEKLQAEILKLTDWYTDDLFQWEGALRLIAPFSVFFVMWKDSGTMIKSLCLRKGWGQPIPPAMMEVRCVY